MPENATQNFTQRAAEKFARYWIHVVAIFADLAAIITIALAFFADYGRNLVTFYVLGLLTTLWILLIIQEYRYARKASYAEAGRFMHSVLHFFRDTMHAAASMTDGELKGNLERSLADVAKAFTLITRTACRASIKVLTLGPDAPSGLNRKDSIRYLRVKTLARDLSSANLQIAETADFVSENTDFQELFENPTQRYFFENDLKRRLSSGTYRNSHIRFGYDNRTDDWPLPYRSTIVWPIRRMIIKDDGALEPDLLGFLCVDSQSRSVFNRRYDFDVGAAFADALYMYIIRQRETRSAVSAG